MFCKYFCISIKYKYLYFAKEKNRINFKQQQKNDMNDNKSHFKIYIFVYILHPSSIHACLDIPPRIKEILISHQTKIWLNYLLLFCKWALFGPGKLLPSANRKFHYEKKLYLSSGLILSRLRVSDSTKLSDLKNSYKQCYTFYLLFPIQMVVSRLRIFTQTSIEN